MDATKPILIEVWRGPDGASLTFMSEGKIRRTVTGPEVVVGDLPKLLATFRVSKKELIDALK